MGLDMYLEKRSYVKNWDHEKKDEMHSVMVLKGNKVTHIKSERVKYVIEEVAYWRKANQIHAWFVKHVQKGVDDCREYEVSEDQLKRLLETVNDVLADRSKALVLLPPQEGFFFGRTELDEYYWQDLEDTRKMLTEILAEGDTRGTFLYQSSW